MLALPVVNWGIALVNLFEDECPRLHAATAAQITITTKKLCLVNIAG
jgi:hypothetical protein